MYILVLNVIMMNKESNRVSKYGEGIDLFNTFPMCRLIIYLMVFIIILYYFIPVDVLMAENFRTDEYLKSWIIREGEKFTVLYTHSVELTPVSETYIIDDDEIILTETWFKSYGAGLPASSPYKFEINHKGFRIYEINQVMDGLTYRTGAVRANHRLILNDKVYNFLDFSNPREGVRFEIRKLSRLKYFIKEVL